MNKEKRRLHQKMIHKLMHKLGGFRSSGWYGERYRIYKKVQAQIYNQKRVALIRQRNNKERVALEGAVSDAFAEMK